ncbi:unnamed protein product [Urochloa humidicola]
MQLLKGVEASMRPPYCSVFAPSQFLPAPSLHHLNFSLLRLCTISISPCVVKQEKASRGHKGQLLNLSGDVVITHVVTHNEKKYESKPKESTGISGLSPAGVLMCCCAGC